MLLLPQRQARSPEPNRQLRSGHRAMRSRGRLSWESPSISACRLPSQDGMRPALSYSHTLKVLHVEVVVPPSPNSLADQNGKLLAARPPRFLSPTQGPIRICGKHTAAEYVRLLA